jgi:hypothetical protein
MKHKSIFTNSKRQQETSKKLLWQTYASQQQLHNHNRCAPGVDVTGNSLTTTSIQLQPKKHLQHSRRRYKGIVAFFF